MSVSLLQTTVPCAVIEPSVRSARVLIFLSRRLMADALSAFFAGARNDVRICLGDLHLKSKSEIARLLESIDDRVVILDATVLRNLESSTDCSSILPSTILLTSPDELTLNGFSRRDIAALVSWDNTFASLRNAIAAVQSGRTYIDQLLAATLDEIARNGSTVLTNRQMQILRLVASGDSSRAIAAKLKLSRRTVENHRARILERLGISSAAEMVTVARKNGWI